MLPVGGTSVEVGEMEEDFEFVEIPESLQLDHIDVQQEDFPEIKGKSDIPEKVGMDLKMEDSNESDHSEDDKEKDEIENEFLLVSSIPDKKKPHDESPDDYDGPKGFRKDIATFKESIVEQYKESGESSDKQSDDKSQSQELDKDITIASLHEYETSHAESLDVANKILFFEQKIIKKELITDEKEDRLEKETIIDENFAKSSAEVKKSEDLDKIHIHEETKKTEIKSKEVHEYSAHSVEELADHRVRLVEEKLEEIFQKVDKDESQDTKDTEPYKTVFDMEETITSDDSFTSKTMKQAAMAAFFTSQIPMEKEEFTQEEFHKDSVTEKTVKDEVTAKEETSVFLIDKTKDTLSLKQEESELDTEVIMQDDEISEKIEIFDRIDKSSTTIKQAALAALFVSRDSDKESEEEKEASEGSEKASVTMKQAFMAVRFITKDSDKDSSLESDEEIFKTDEIPVPKRVAQSLINKQLLAEIPPKSNEEIDKCDTKESEKEFLFDEESVIFKEKGPILIEKTDRVRQYEKEESHKEEIKQFTKMHKTEAERVVTDIFVSEGLISKTLSQEREIFEAKRDIENISLGIEKADIETGLITDQERESESEEEKEVTVEKEIPEELEKTISIKHAAMAAMFISKESETSASSTDDEKEFLSWEKDVHLIETTKTMRESAIAALFVSKRSSPDTVTVETEEKEVSIEKEYTEESEKDISLKQTDFEAVVISKVLVDKTFPFESKEKLVKKEIDDRGEIIGTIFFEPEVTSSEEELTAIENEEIDRSKKGSAPLEQVVTEETSHVSIKQAALATVFIGKESFSSSLAENETEEIIDRRDISKDIVIEERIEQEKDKYPSTEQILTTESQTKADDVKKTEESTFLDLDQTVRTMKQAGLAAVFISKEDDAKTERLEEFPCHQLDESSEIDSTKEISLKQVALATIFISDDMKKVDKEDSEDTMSEEDMVEVAGLKKEINMKPAALAAAFLASDKKFSSLYSNVSDVQLSLESDVSTVTLPDKPLLDREHFDIDIDPEIIGELDQDLDISEKELESDEEKEIDEALGTVDEFEQFMQEHQEKTIYAKEKMPIESVKDKFGLTGHIKELEKTVQYVTSVTGSLLSQQVPSEISEIKLMSEESEKYKIKETDEYITAAVSDISDSMKGYFKESKLESRIADKVEKIVKVIAKTEEQSLEIKEDKKTDLRESKELFQDRLTSKESKIEEDQSPEKFVHETIESVHKIKYQEEQLISTSESRTLLMHDIDENQLIIEDRMQEDKNIEIIDEKSESEADDGTEKFEMESPEDVKPVQKKLEDFLSDDELSLDDNESEICVVAAELVSKVLEKTVQQLESEQEMESEEEKYFFFKSEKISTTLEETVIKKESEKISTTLEETVIKKESDHYERTSPETIFAAMTNIPSFKQDTVLRTVSPTPYEIVPELGSDKSEIVLTSTDAMQLPTALVTSQPPFLLEQPLVAEHVIVPPQTKEDAVKSQPLTDSVSRVDQVLKTPIDVEERFPLPSSKETFHDIILEKHPPITKISPEEESSSSEEEISPVEEYPPTLGADMKIPVGVSPTEEKILSELPDLTQTSDTDLIDKTIIVPDISQIKIKTSTTQQDTSQGYDSFMCYDNGAFVGEEQIDLEESLLERDEESDCVQHELEVTREILKRWEEEKAAKEMETSESLYQFDYREESVLKQIKSEIFSEEMEQSIGSPSPEAKQIFKDSPEETVAKHIRSEIFATEMEQSIDTPSPEQKEIFEEGEEETVARHIRNEIFAEEFNQSIETPSPERKEISHSLSSESVGKDESDLAEIQREVVEKTVQQIIKTSAEICAEEAAKEMKMSVATIDKSSSGFEVMEKSFNIAEEHTPEQVLWEVSVQEQIEPREEAESLVSDKEPLAIDTRLSDEIHQVDESKTSLDLFTVATVISDVVALAMHSEKESKPLEKETVCKGYEDQIKQEREETRKFSSESSEISGEDLEEKIDFHLDHEHIMSEMNAQMYQPGIYKSCELSDEDLNESVVTQEDTSIKIQEQAPSILDSVTFIKSDDKAIASFTIIEEHYSEDSSSSTGQVHVKEDFDMELVTKIDAELSTEECEKEVDICVTHHKTLSEPYDSSDSYKSYGDSSEKIPSESHFYAFDTSSSHASQETAEGYMTCVTSQEGSEKTSGDASYGTAVTSQESYKTTIRSSQEDSYHTAHSSWSSSGVSDSSYDESAASSVASSYKSRYETSESETMLASDTETEERTTTPLVYEDKYFFEKELDPFPEAEASGSKRKSSLEDVLESEFSKKYFDEALEAWCEAGKTEFVDDDDDDHHPTSPFEIIETAEIALYEDYADSASLAATMIAGSIMETSQTSTTESFESLHAESEQISSIPSYSHINGPVEVDYYPEQALDQRSRGVVEIELSSDTHAGAAVTATEASSILEQSPDEPVISRTESGEVPQGLKLILQLITCWTGC